jgi:hypothetical protein
MSGLLGFARVSEGSCLPAWCTVRMLFASMQQCRRNNSMIISTLYLPETAVNVQRQSAPARGFCAGQKGCSVMSGTVR